MELHRFEIAVSFESYLILEYLGDYSVGWAVGAARRRGGGDARLAGEATRVRLRCLRALQQHIGLASGQSG